MRPRTAESVLEITSLYPRLIDSMFGDNAMSTAATKTPLVILGVLGSVETKSIGYANVSAQLDGK